MLAHPPDPPKPHRSRGRPTQEDVAGIDSWLLQVALGEFLAHGYGATSMARIVRVARISKTTLYSRYSSKEELFRAIMRQQIERASAATMLVPRNGRLDLEAGLNSYGNHALEISLTGDLLGVNRLVASECLRFPELAAASTEATGLGIAHITDFIRQCAVMDGIPCSNPQEVAEAFIFMLRGWYANIMLTNATMSLPQRRQWVSRTVRMLIEGRSSW
jgi:AcrR family transcriptional regulator